jgi:hypothetical protein
VLLPLWNVGIYRGAFKLGSSNNGGNLLSQAYSFDGVWQNVGFWASIFVYFIAILIIIAVTNEYQFRTSRQNVIDGQRRLDFYHAKCLLILSFALATTLIVFLTGTIFGFATGSPSSFPGHLEFLGYTFLLALDYYGFAFVLALLCKRSGIAIGLLIGYSLMFEFMLTGLLNWLTHSKLGSYLPLQASDELLPFPLMESLKEMIGFSSQEAWSYMLVTSGWIFLYYFLGRRKVLTSDW